MSDYSIELSAVRIYDSRTRQYFEEVIKSYTTGSYRSATVMLWSIVICDLIYKLQHLKEVHNDTIAGEILDQIETKQEANPNSPDWEIQLVEKVNERMQLLEVSDYQNILTLQKHRHLSAHPVLKSTQLLFEPHKEMVRSDIRNMLDGVLIKPPILYEKIINELVSDLENI